MSADLFVVLSPAALALFILWDSGHRRWTNAKPIRRSAMHGTFTPGECNKESVLFIAAAVAGMASLLAFGKPPHSPFDGRSRWLLELIHSWLGPYGIAVLFLAAAVLLHGVVTSARRRRLQNARDPNRSFDNGM